ncbi:MAG: stage III sporulation protein AC [Defluviitaleaceae bacterium]|nr:stage III sporulation protein AC [Defluviitaleaceae bacterium]
MDISLLFQIAAVGILITVLSQVLKSSGRDEQATMITIAGIVLVLFWIVGHIADLFTHLRVMFEL